ncbi:1,3-beta-glucanosyltransferase [Mucor velutinosus]|uniref:1,3-beta-glucanosyltransferase n=1 Tax=Mucor velutinosus TaxID=708070 RepID=A0AAN7DHC8_9FUNG|nr:1,3-beta-glucanosyltransferase [Mucor velutinosus]
MSSAWDKLPFEVLTYIFEHNVDSNSRYIQTRKDFYNYQLVCKGWSKAAQSLLYRRISCQDDNIEDELQRFVQFIFTIKVLAPHTGDFVKTITVCDHLDRLEEPLTALDAIFNSCPKLEDFYCNGSSKEVAWPYLLTLPDARLGNIRSIVEDKDSLNYSFLYPFVASKLDKSLSKLHFVEIHRQSTWHSRYLLDKLSQFVSLRELALDECEFNSYGQICQVLDKCSSTVTKLSISKYWPVSSLEVAISEVANPNYSIKEISISRSLMNTVSYFAAKFKNLQKLTMEQVVPLKMIDPDWIHGLTDLCSSLREYNLCFNLGLETVIKDRCIDLTKKASPKDTFLVIDYIVENEGDPYEDDMFDLSGRITLKKNGTRSGIEVSLPRTEFDEDYTDSEFDYHTHWFDNYSPNHITIKHIEEADFIKSALESGHLSMATTPTEFAISLRDFQRRELIGAKNWTILTRSLLSTADTTDAVVSFSGMFVPNLNGRTTHLETSSSPNVKQLTFSNSILYHQVLPIVSKWLPNIDILIFNACFILLEEPYTLSINLPETKLRRLAIVTGAPSFMNALPYEATVGRSQSRNIDLISALFPGNQYTLRVKANEKTYLYNVKNNTSSPISNQDQADYCGTNDNFLIWIQCKELEELSIANERDSYGLEHRFAL